MTAVVMHQKWRELLFLHWTIEPEVVQATLPPGLEVDCFDGRAWLGVVPFLMRGIRPRFLPPVPYLSNFLEANVRTYVRDRHGRSGVWFYSLDCDRGVAVSTARRFFSLPYFRAAMQTARHASGALDYRVQRRGAAASSRFVYRGAGPVRQAAAGSLEHFLAERYRLFAWQPGPQRLITGEVEHVPYPLQDAVVLDQDTALIELAGFEAPAGPPEHALYSAGVDVRVRRVESV